MSRHPTARWLCATAACTLGLLALTARADDEMHPPPVVLRLDTSVTPALLPMNVASPVAATITVTNDGPEPAFGVLVHEPFLTVVLAEPSITVTASDLDTAWAVVGLDPLLVSVPILAPGASVAVTIAGTMLPECWMEEDLTTTAYAVAWHVPEVTADLTLGFDRDGPEICNGVDDDCDEAIDEGGDALCADVDVCNGALVCGGAAGCVAGTPPDCDDGNPCTIDACVAGTGCTATPDVTNPDCGLVTSEVCDNCADDDGDGLVDAEDPDCCAETHGLVVSRLRIEPGPAGQHTRLWLLARDPSGTLGDATAAETDVGLQVLDAEGALLCTCITPDHWTTAPKGRRFRDRGHAYAAGLDRGRIRDRAGAVVQLNTRGDGMGMRRPAGGRVRVLVRSGTRCLVAERDLLMHRGLYRVP